MKVETIIIITVFAALAVCVLIGIWLALTRREPPPPADTLDRIPPATREPEDEPIFRISLVILAVGALLLTMIPDSRSADLTPQKPQRITLNLADCPPPGPGMTSVLMFIINTRADGKPLQSTCARIAQRNYQPAAPRKPSARPAPIKEQP